MSERTYRREHVVEAAQRWTDGEFGDEWQAYRTLAAARGFIFPPEGSRHDSVEDERPSQRAIVYRAIEDTPRLLREAISRSSSWHGVVAQLMHELSVRREEAGIEDRQTTLDRDALPGKREAAERIGSILGRLAP